MSAPDIFLSYNREDQARAKVFAEAFGAQGFSVWWDTELRSGEAYDEVTESALRTAKAVVVLWSKKSVVSRWVRAEATLADRNKTLVPCMIEPCERPIMFELTQTAELGHWQGEAGDRAWTAFLADVRRFVGREALVAPQPVAAAAPPAPKGERGDRPSLAVMPFANRSGVADDDALAFGMAEDVVSAISLSPDIRVIATGSTQRWAGKPADLRDVGRELGVRYMLEGNLRRAGANLRVTVQLVEAETGAIAWNQKFDRPLSELAELQEDLVTEVTARLGVAVQSLELERALRKPGDLSAYEAGQRAWVLVSRARPDDVALGIAEARRAVAIAPDYGAAYGILAQGLSMAFAGSGAPALKAEVLANVQRAVELSPKDPNTPVLRVLRHADRRRTPRSLASRAARRADESKSRHGMGRSRVRTGAAGAERRRARQPRRQSPAEPPGLRFFACSKLPGHRPLSAGPGGGGDRGEPSRPVVRPRAPEQPADTSCALQARGPGGRRFRSDTHAEGWLSDGDSRLPRRQLPDRDRHVEANGPGAGRRLPQGVARDAGMSAPDIFLSYNREDQARAKVFAEAFGAQGFSVWWDTELKSGEAYDEVTENALRGAKAVVVLWSKKSVVSRWVRAEATLADRNKTLVPCMIEACERPIMFELTQTAELGHWQGDASDRAWTAFLADVRRFVGREAQAAPAPIPAVAPQPAPKGERGDKPSLAVMPFANRSGQAADDALAFGMVEDIISAISPSPEVRVLASSATQRWAGKPADLREVGRDLGVRYVLEGNTRRAGANLRVTVQLVEAETGAILWTQKLDRPLSELAELQEELVTEVASHLGVAVQNLEFERVLQKPGDITAYEACQRAFILIGRMRPDDITRGIVEARRAIAIAPDYGAAYGLLALGQGQVFRMTADEAVKADVLRNVDRATGLSPKDPRLLTYVSFALVAVDLPREALRHAQRAVQLNPNHGPAHAALGFAQISLGSLEQGIASLDVTHRLSPGDIGAPLRHARRALARYLLGQVERAVEEIEAGFALDPGLLLVLYVRIAVSAAAGRPAEAAESVRGLRAVMKGMPVDAHIRRLSSMADLTTPPGAELVAAFRKAWDETPA
jgi:TolB-like protein/methylmalonyl-CoA mutase cobalamin-binding subunit